MNRVIRFRGRKSFPYGNVWYYGSLWQNAYGEAFIRTDKGISLGVDPETVGQFTGLLDSDKADIYEGDYLEYIEQYDKDHALTEYGYVAYELGEFVIKNVHGAVTNSLPFLFQDGIYPPINHVKVIGNRKDNPVLLIQLSTNNEPQG
ncbi:MAG: YopX family protein [Lachnospiraceae bacterium]|nr:YopX family protein [Lachnospiraceae bacterium]